MRFRLALALSVSILLIGTASWYRYGINDYTQSNIVTVEQFGTNSAYSADIVRDFLEPRATSTAPVAPLSDTEIIGRQLIADYINLAMSGQATETSINALADRYVESIPTLNKTPAISYADIKVVPNIKVNFQNYANELMTIHKNYAERIARTYTKGANLNTLGPELYSLTATFSIAYEDAASKLKNMAVPASIVPAHIQLVNSYLSSAMSMRAVSETEQDAATSFAGLIMLNDNLKKEDALINTISQILTSNDI